MMLVELDSVFIQWVKQESAPSNTLKKIIKRGGIIFILTFA
jgi:hypothetical protein